MFKILKNGKVFTPQKIGLQNILICQNKIVFMGKDPISLPKELDVQEYDLKGATIIPGLIDAHTHPTGAGGETGPNSCVPPLTIQQFTSFGVTTNIGMLGTDDLSRTTSSLIIKTRALNSEGMSSYCYTGGYHLPLTTLTGSARSDIVNIEQIIGIGEFAISDHRSSQPSLDEFLRLASEAHVAGIMSGKAGVFHLHLGNGQRRLELIRKALKQSEIPARVFYPSHVNRKIELFEEALELVNQGCTIDITTGPEELLPGGIEASKALAQYLDKNLPADKITVSSDAGGGLPVFDDNGQPLAIQVGTSKGLIPMIQKLAKDGRPLETILPAFTSNTANLLKLPHKGTLQTNADADLVVLDDELSIQHVMAQGQWHVFDGQVKIFGQYTNN